jgi:hypothetical protein
VLLDCRRRGQALECFDVRCGDLGINRYVESTVRYRSIIDLIKINADMGRLGGLIFAMHCSGIRVFRRSLFDPVALRL